MRESVAKATTRRLYYTECLPEWLLREDLQGGQHLVLLGAERHELDQLTTLGVQSQNIWSVESDLATYRQQARWAGGVNRYYGSMAEFLETMLHMNHRVVHLNLDIEGSYLRKLDPAMSSILLFCWRNPQTVVSTYGTVTRDVQTLREGVRSLMTLLAIAPEATQSFCANLQHCYEDAGFSQPFRMVLRDCFWIRSNLEHTLSATALVLPRQRDRVDRFLLAQQATWKWLRARKPQPTRLRHLLESADHLSTSYRLDQLRLGIQIDAVQNIVYIATQPWTQRCYLARYRLLDQPRDTRHWLERTYAAFRSRPFIAINRLGRATRLAWPEWSSEMSPTMLVWDRSDIYRSFQPRKLVLPQLTPSLAGLAETVRVLSRNTRRKKRGGHR
ncbi:hypothetical protein HY374_01850 [Candidatus Berkelbacteria bacterium]|nr:hypothetical protein [Candidatus Berkelbacteria bacterium]